MFEVSTKSQRVVASIAMSLAFFAYFPQLYHIIKNRSAEDISAVFLFFMMVASGLWMLYAFLRRDMLMLIAYGAGLGMAAFTLVLKVHYHKNPRKTPPE